MSDNGHTKIAEFVEGQTNPPAASKTRATAAAIEALLWSGRDLATAMRVSLATFHRLKAARLIGPKAIRFETGSCTRYSVAECKDWIAARMADGRLMTRKEWEAWTAVKQNGHR